MTSDQLANTKSGVIRASMDAMDAVTNCRMRLAVIGQRLEALGRAFQEHPEQINPLPEPSSVFDYREAIRILRAGEEQVQMCNHLRLLIQQAKGAEQRRVAFVSGPFFSSSDE